MRTFFTSLAGLIVVSIIVIVIVLIIGWSRVPDVIANNLSKKLKVYVEIGGMHLGWGEIKIKKIEIGNPPGTIQTQSFRCKQVDIKIPFTRLFNKQIVIDEIDLNDVYLDLEFDSASGTKGNWSRIMNNLQESSVSEKKPSSSSEQEKSARSVFIRTLAFNNIDTDVIYIKDGGKVIHLPRIDRIELHDIGSEGGVPMDQIMNSVLGQMLKSVFQKQNLKNMLQDLIQNPPSNLQKYLSPFKGFFNFLFIPKTQVSSIALRLEVKNENWNYWMRPYGKQHGQAIGTIPQSLCLRSPS
jgi:hypothetical protein